MKTQTIRTQARLCSNIIEERHWWYAIMAEERHGWYVIRAKDFIQVKMS